MNFKELVEAPVEKSDNNLSVLLGCYYNHLVDDISEYDLDYSQLSNASRAEVRYYKDFCFDGRRVWMLYSVWLDDELVMLCKNAGREGDDHTGRAIFNEPKFHELVKYVRSFQKEPDTLDGLCSLDDNADSFESFYNNSLFGYFERY